MTEKPVFLTDPARELADLCDDLSRPANIPGSDLLALHFGVEPWTAEFFQIIHCIVQRADNLIEILDDLGLDEDYKADAVHHIQQVQMAFVGKSLHHPWESKGMGASLLSSENVQPIKMLQPLVRKQVSYARLSDADIAALLDEVAEFETWLTEHQLVDQDFVRQAILDGLKQFSFRVEKVRWLGWGYTLGSLREVIAAYKLLETLGFDPAADPNAEAILKKGKGFFIKVFQRVGVAKDTIERADFLLKAYGAISLTYQGTSVAGLLTHLT